MKAEDIFNENAKKVMIQWSLDDFKKTHPHLCKVVLDSINQALNLHNVVGRSEQLVAFLRWLADGTYENNAEKIVKKYLDEGN